MKKLNYFLLFFFAFSQMIFSQQKKEKTFWEIRENYQKMTIDDIRAMPFVKVYIHKAKRENNLQKLIQGYRDGRQFDFANKMKYADSALAISIKYKNNDDISKDYLSKGIIYYFYKKKYKLALNEYLNAYEYSKDSKDEYHHYKVVYHLGIVKEHLGYYDEALEHFRNCAEFYSTKMNSKMHENILFNYKKAYYNSLHQMTVVNRYLKNFLKSDSLSELGYQLTKDDQDFLIENSYFLKCKGISKFHKGNYTEAQKDLEQALPILLQRNDFAWSSVIFYYLGKISEARNQVPNAIKYYSAIDSIFEKQQFILPEIYRSYNYLITHYKHKDLNRQLYYTNQLLKADSLITKDYPYLSSKLHKNYDRSTLMKEKENIEKTARNNMWFANILILTGSVAFTVLTFKYVKDQKIKKQYDLLQKRIAEGNNIVVDKKVDEPTGNSMRKTFLTPELSDEIGTKLEKFEKDLQFTKKRLTQNTLATKFNTNSRYLSAYINENKGVNFNKYIAELRINYITNLLNTNNKYLNFTLEALADECGIVARQNFSKVFFEINGIRPTDYIKKRKQELGLS
ncbi:MULTISPECIES: helix-turn-helix domain-containing protein [Chryseobacterium]|uniref:helix-turn-helix domain-containing protein n=1 Tax=Chryseobacterium TaxID=59732 RepID=UPI0004829AE7|nr:MULTISPECIES: helix-turn-helix domain-containing protein [Chryseobacterium]MDR6156622.1 AraC-like DNA-binding protein [Chryseobacterium sp. SLBN-27]